MAIPDSKLVFQKHVRLLRTLLDEGNGKPETLILAVLHVWQKQCYPFLVPDRTPRGSAKLAPLPEVTSFVSWLAGRPFLDSAYWLATAYSVLVSEEKRARRALFFTPPILANRLIDQLILSGACLKTQRWHDPACGGAAFLVPVALRMIAALKAEELSAQQQLASISERISGNDLDPFLLRLSHALIEMALYGLISNCRIRPKFKLTRGDALISSLHPKKLDVVLANPPYRKLESRETEKYSKYFGDVIEGQPNIYGLFMRLAISSVAYGGLVGLLTPTSFLSGAYFSRLRSSILKSCEVNSIDVLRERSMFIGVDQETAISVLRKAVPKKDSFSKPMINVLCGREFQALGSTFLPKKGPWPIPRSEGQASTLKKASQSSFRLKDYGYSCRIGSLVGYRDTRPRFSVPPKDGTIGRNNHVLPLVWATDIAADGKLLHGRKTRFRRHDQFVELAKTAGGVVTRPAVLLQRLTSSDQKRRLVAADVPQGAWRRYKGIVCENHVIVLEAEGETRIPEKVLASILNSRFINDVFRCISGPSNVSVFELAELMLPDPGRLMSLIRGGGDLETLIELAYS